MSGKLSGGQRCAAFKLIDKIKFRLQVKEFRSISKELPYKT